MIKMVYGNLIRRQFILPEIRETYFFAWETRVMKLGEPVLTNRQPYKSAAAVPRICL